jgi:hypothetical protein
VDYIPATNVTWILFRRPVFIFHLSWWQVVKV